MDVRVQQVNQYSVITLQPAPISVNWKAAPLRACHGCRSAAQRSCPSQMEPPGPHFPGGLGTKGSPPGGYVSSFSPYFVFSHLHCILTEL